MNINISEIPVLKTARNMFLNCELQAGEADCWTMGSIWKWGEKALGNHSPHVQSIVMVVVV
jgi:hypothetical protein